MERFSKRHEGDLNARLRPFNETEQTRVVLNIDSAAAHLPSVQHTAWMLLNLLCRLIGVVNQVVLVCPRDVRVAARVVPFAHSANTLREALLLGARELPLGSVVDDSGLPALYNRHRLALAGFPCHTTVHAGPHTAVRQETTVTAQARGARGS